MPGFERCTPRLQHVFQDAHEVAKLLGHNYVGTEHLLLAMLRDRHKEAAAGALLSAKGVSAIELAKMLVDGDGVSESDLTAWISGPGNSRQHPHAA